MFSYSIDLLVVCVLFVPVVAEVNTTGVHTEVPILRSKSAGITIALWFLCV